MLLNASGWEILLLVFCVKAHRCPAHATCSPGLNESPLGIFPINSTRPLRDPPRSPISHSALPWQLMPSATTDEAPHRMEIIVLGRIMEGLERQMGFQWVGKMKEMTCVVQSMKTSGMSV